MCADFPCTRLGLDSEYDAVVTRQNQRADMERAAVLGMETYAEEQREKAEILRALLENYNDGRRKTLFCVAVNLLPLPALHGVLETLRQSADEPLKATRGPCGAAASGGRRAGKDRAEAAAEAEEGKGGDLNGKSDPF